MFNLAPVRHLRVLHVFQRRDVLVNCFSPLHLRGNIGPPPRLSADFIMSSAFVAENLLGTVLVYLIPVRCYYSHRGRSEQQAALPTTDETYLDFVQTA